MTSVVLDASVAAQSLVGRRVIVDDDEFHSHAGLDVEVVSVLRRYAARGTMPPHEARESLGYFLATDIERHSLTRLLPRMWDLRHDISAYDAGYVALAESLGMPLVTLDRRLAATAQRYCDVVVPS